MATESFLLAAQTAGGARAISASGRRPPSRLIAPIAQTVGAGNAAAAAVSLAAGLKLKMSKGGKIGKFAAALTPLTPVEQPFDDLFEEAGGESIDLEMEFELTMMPSLMDCSRQKLRMFHMNLLKYGANVNERVNSKDLLAAFQECNIKIPSRAIQLISEVYEDSKGIDFQRVYRRLEKAQAKTGRDSVNARQTIADRSLYNQIPVEVREADFLRRVEEQLVQCSHYFDLDNYRKACLEKDISKTGKLSKGQMEELAKFHSLPIYGALLCNLLNWCDDEKNGMVSWPEFMNYLMKSMDNYCTNNPDKPKPGAMKPKLEQGSVSSRGSRTTSYVESADVKIEVQSTRPTPKSRTSNLFKSLGARAREKAGSEKLKRDLSPVPSTTPESQLSSTDDMRAMVETSNIPTAEFRIKGQQMKFVIPSNISKNHVAKVDPPTQRLKLDWVYGYNGRDVKNNISVVGSGELMYAVGHIIVLLNYQSERRQRHYKEHTAQVSCISLHSDETTVASAQSLHGHHRSEIRIWRSDNLQTVSVICDQQIIISSYTSLSFYRPQGKLLSSITSAQRTQLCNQLLTAEIRDEGAAYISVWDISNTNKISELIVETEQLNCVSFNPCLPNIIVTLGKEHFQWWRLSAESASINPVNEPNFGMHMKARSYTCAYHTSDGDMITGDSNGTVYIWPCGSNSLSNLIKHAHEGPITALEVVNSTLITCGRDGMMKLWKYGFHLDKLYDIKFPEDDSVVKSVVYHDGILLMGSTANTLMSFDVELDSAGYITDLQFHPLPHSQGVVGRTVATRCLRGSAERERFFLVSGSAGAVVLYDNEAKMAVGRAVLKDTQITSIDFSRDGELVCVATSAGQVMLFECREGFKLEKLVTLPVCKSRLTLISLSPDTSTIAAVSSTTVYIITERRQQEVTDTTEWTISGKFKAGKQGAAISHIDWSTKMINGDYILRVCSVASLQVTLWNVSRCEQIKSIQLFYDCVWSSDKCPLTYSVAGIWYSKQCRENDLQCIDINKSRSLLAMCDKQGYLCLFQHPCTTDGAFCHTYKSNVSTSDVNFSDNNVVLSTGASDGCIMQWKIV